ncbi:MAG: DUF4430 domain-containing protein [Candidatus Micrarchaeota archaeon]
MLKAISIIAALAVLLAGCVAAPPSPGAQYANTSSVVLSAVPESNSTPVAGVQLIINYGNSSFNASVVAGTALDALLEASRAQGFEVGLQAYPELNATLVTSVNGTQNGEGGKYWLVFVNGKLSPVGGDKALLREGDAVEWRFGSNPFG